MTELSVPDTPIFSFPDNNLCKCQGILTKLGTCIDIKEIWFGIANGQIPSMFDSVICPPGVVVIVQIFNATRQPRRIAAAAWQGIIVYRFYLSIILNLAAHPPKVHNDQKLIDSVLRDRQEWSVVAQWLVHWFLVLRGFESDPSSGWEISGSEHTPLAGVVIMQCVVFQIGTLNGRLYARRDIPFAG